MNTGFIGTGSMGTILIKSFIKSRALRPNEIVATNRTISKAEQLATEFPGLLVADSNQEVAASCDLLFLCIKPTEFQQVIDEISSIVRPNQQIISITSPVMIDTLEQRLPAKIAKVIPSITNFLLSGPMLCIYGNRMKEDDIESLERLLSQISHPVRISEKHTRVSSDISSCGPAFFALLLERFMEAAVAETGIDPEHASLLATQMLYGTGLLLTCGEWTPGTLQQQVAVPGGITAQGLHLLENRIGDMFHQLFRITHAKYEEDVEKVAAMLQPQLSD